MEFVLCDMIESVERNGFADSFLSVERGGGEV